MSDSIETQIKETQSKWVKVALSITLVLAASLLTSFVSRQFGAETVEKAAGWFFSAALGLLGFVGIVGAIFTYLNRPRADADPMGRYKKTSDFDPGLETELLRLRLEFKSELETIKQAVVDIGKVNFDFSGVKVLTDEKVEELQGTVTKRIVEVLDVTIPKSVDEAFVRRDEKNKAYVRTVADFEEIKKGLVLEKEALSRRANVNLAIGAAVTIVAGLGLVYIVYFNPLDLTNAHGDEYPWKITAHYIPRLSFIIFAEIFAYFFLKLYKTGLADIKYYQNEISNIEMKLVALKAAMSLEDGEALKAVISDLSKTERNFILKPGESTIDLEKFKHDGIDTKSLAESIATFLKVK